MTKIALQLIIAHFIGDFLLQPDHWVNHKKEKRQRSVFLYLHVLVHLMALVVLLQFQLVTYWKGILTIIASHFVIDLIKLHLLQKSGKENTLFWVDQLVHLLVIAGVAYLYEPFAIDMTKITSAPTLLLIAAVLFVTVVSSVFIKIIVSRWAKDIDTTSGSLRSAGKYIGILERLFVFTFIIFNQWQAIGFLVAAKSVFRFGDLSKERDRKLTEYIIVGTFLSFAFAILTGIGYGYVLEHLSR